MLMARSIATLVLIGLSLSLTTRADEPPAAAEEAWALPKWRIGAGVYVGDPIVAVHRRLSERCDLGFQVLTTLRAGRSEGDTESRGYEDSYATSDSDSDESDSYLALYGELRRWRPLASRLACFGGLRLVAIYDHDRDERTSFSDSEADWLRLRTERDTDYLALGAGLTLGADLELMRRLSATFALSPLTLSHSWRHEESTTVLTHSDRPDERVSLGEDWDRDLTLQTSLSAEVYLTLSF